jgi:hypothetical protein
MLSYEFPPLGGGGSRVVQGLARELASLGHPRSDGPLDRGTNRSGPKRCSGKVLGLIRLPSVPFLGAFSVGIAGKRPRLLRIRAPSSNARMICGGLGVGQARGVDFPVRVAACRASRWRAAGRAPRWQPADGVPSSGSDRPTWCRQRPPARGRAVRLAYRLAANELWFRRASRIIRRIEILYAGAADRPGRRVDMTQCGRFAKIRE